MTSETVERLSYRPNECARVLGLSRDKVFEAIRDGSLRSVKCGGARLITTEAMREFLAGLEERDR